MMNLKQWLNQKLHRPVLGLILVLILSEGIHLGLLVKQSEEELQKTTALIAQYVSLGVQEQNRSLIEYTLNLTYKAINAQGMAICNDSQAIVQVGNLNNLCVNYSANFINRKIIIPTFGSHNNYMVVIVPMVPNLGSLFFVLFLSIFLLVALFVVQKRMLASLNKDILDPLMIQTASIQKVKIKEINVILDQLAQAKAVEKNRAIAQLSSQVAHDIRSPLTALNMSLKETNSLPEEKRILIRSAVMRITDIANQLSAQNGKNLEQSNTQNNSLLVSSIVESIVSEKRMQFRNNIGVDISFENDSSSYGIFAKFNAAEFKTVLSNLINNSVEAIEESGKIEVLIEDAGELVSVRIKDSGKGIASDLLSKIGERGFTQGKVGRGTGLGLFHAKQTLHSWGGQLKINSQLNIGTTVSLLIPRSETPEWFLPAIDLSSLNQIVILDDDISIHNIWDERLQPFVDKHLWLKVIHCSTPEDFRLKVAELRSDLSKVLFLADYELIGHSETGLDLVEKLGVAKNSVLVSSRFEDLEIKNSCKRLGIKFIPKNLAPHVPLVLSISENDNKPDAVLIDDDFLIRLSWKDSGKRAGINLATFSNAEDFFKVASTLSSEIPIYIDSNLGEGTHGEKIAQVLFKKYNFCTIYLATGYSAIDFDLTKFPYLKGLIGKENPWA